MRKQGFKDWYSLVIHCSDDVLVESKLTVDPMVVDLDTMDCHRDTAAAFLSEKRLVDARHE
jgi:hypothetical protein